MNAKKGFAPLILLIVIAVVAIGGGAYYYANRSEETPIETSIENWKTYENRQFGYSFKHPERFNIIQPLAQGYEGGNIIVDSNVSYIAAYVVTTPHPPLKRPADIIINGYPAVFSSGKADYRTGINIYKGDNLIVIYLLNVKKDVDANTHNLFQQMASTIKISN